MTKAITVWHWSFAYKTMTGMQYTRILTHIQQRNNWPARMQRTNSYSCATHEVWHLCFLLACRTWCITRMQHTKYGSRALHEFYSQAAHFMSHVCVDWVTRQKLKTTPVLGARRYQLRRELCRKVEKFFLINKFVYPCNAQNNNFYNSIILY